MTKPRPSPDRVDCYACMRRNPKYKKYHFRVKVCHPEKSQSRGRAVSSLSLSLSLSLHFLQNGAPSFLPPFSACTHEGGACTYAEEEGGRKENRLPPHPFIRGRDAGGRREREREREVFSLVPPVPGKDNRAWKNIDTN